MEAVMLRTRVDQALKIRANALRYLRRGDRFNHRLLMKEVHLPLLMARTWKPKSCKQ